MGWQRCYIGYVGVSGAGILDGMGSAYPTLGFPSHSHPIPYEMGFPSHLFSCKPLIFSIPFVILALLLLALSLVTQIRGHIAGPPPHSPVRYVPSFCREKNSTFSSLVDSRGVVLTHRCWALWSAPVVPFFFVRLCKYSQNLTTVGIELKDQR